MSNFALYENYAVLESTNEPQVITNTTSATSTTTGALIVAGGAGINENLHVGGDLFVTGTGSSTSFYHQETVSRDWTCTHWATDTQSFNCLITRIGKMVTICFCDPPSSGSLDGGANSQITTSVALDSEYWPDAVNAVASCIIQDGANSTRSTLGVIKISSVGLMTVSKTANNGNFTASSGNLVGMLNGNSITYAVA